MPDCECLAGCPFFNDRMAHRPATSGVYKRRFCLGDNVKCARYQIFRKLGKDAVPSDLYPNEQDRAEKLLNAAPVV